MYVPDAFVAAAGCFIAYEALPRVLTCKSSIGRRLALPSMWVGCRKMSDGSKWICDVCALYGVLVTILFGGGTIVFAAIGVWHLVFR